MAIALHRVSPPPHVTALNSPAPKHLQCSISSAITGNRIMRGKWRGGQGSYPHTSMCGDKSPAPIQFVGVRTLPPPPIFPHYTIACGSAIYSAERKQTSADVSVSPYSV